MIRLQSDPIRGEELCATVRDDGDGAVALFLGTVRNRNLGRRVVALEYHAYPEMAESEMRKIVDAARARFEISGVALVHRVGRLEIGEPSVGVAVSAAHRAPAFDACRFIIDTLKRTVPIWKKEWLEDGSVWVDGDTPGAPPIGD